MVLAYSGGLDTSIILKWLQTTYKCEVVTFTADLGQGEELEPARQKALLLGIKPENIFIEDLREEFVRDYVFPMFRANAQYEGPYLLGTSIARPLIAKKQIEIAEKMRLGNRATESEVKVLSNSSQLADYRVVHFATHGAMAGELHGSAEPGLLLTPPAEASTDDDGYLSASEIAGLRFDADWVILSACNTAAGDARRAMLAMIDKGKLPEAHPAFWAPFIVVGEGAK